MRVRHPHRVLALSAVICLGLPTLTACDKSPKERLQGKWRGVSVEHVQAPQEKNAEGWARQTTIEFSGANVTVAIPAEAPQAGTFAIAKVDGDNVTVNFKRPDRDKVDSSDFRFTKDGKLVWSLGGADVVMTKAVD